MLRSFQLLNTQDTEELLAEHKGVDITHSNIPWMIQDKRLCCSHFLQVIRNLRRLIKLWLHFLKHRLTVMKYKFCTRLPNLYIKGVEISICICPYVCYSPEHAPSCKNKLYRAFLFSRMYNYNSHNGKA